MLDGNIIATLFILSKSVWSSEPTRSQQKRGSYHDGLSTHLRKKPIYLSMEFI